MSKCISEMNKVAVDYWRAYLGLPPLKEPDPPPPYVTVTNIGHCFEDVGERA